MYHMVSLTVKNIIFYTKSKCKAIQEQEQQHCKNTAPFHAQLQTTQDLDSDSISYHVCMYRLEERNTSFVVVVCSCRKNILFV